MAEYNKQTDEVQVVTLESKIIQVFWGNRLAIQEDKIEFEAWTQFVGNGSKIEIKVEDKKGKSVAKSKGKVFGNEFRGAVIVPKKAKEWITFTAKLPDHGLEMKSAPAIVIPAIEVTNQKWSQKEARRGDVLKLTADVEGIPDETEVMIHIYEYDQDGAHDFIAKFPTTIKDSKIEVEWAYEYHEDTDEIPTDEEKKKYGGEYNPPEYFWVVEFAEKRFGDEQESGILEFKDWIDIQLIDDEGTPIPDQDYTLHLADGTKKEGKTDDAGRIFIEDIPPGGYRIEYANEAQSQPVADYINQFEKNSESGNSDGAQGAEDLDAQDAEGAVPD